MSRSYKKSPVIIGCYHSKRTKKVANKKVRQAEEIPNGMAYRKVYDSENIKDFTARQSLEELLKEYETNISLQERFPTEQDLRTYWKLNYIGK